MSLTIVGTPTTQQVWGGSAVFTRTTTAGNTLVCYVGSNTGNSISDSAGNTWTLVGDTASVGATSQRVGQMWVCPNADAVTSVTVTHGGSNKAFSGSLVELASDNPVEVVDTGVALSDPATVDTAAGGAVLTAGFYYTGTITYPSGYTQLPATVQSGFNVVSAYLLGASAGTDSPYFSGASSDDMGILTVSLAEQASAPEPLWHLVTGSGTSIPLGNPIVV